jgi:hypothetical protein
MFAIIYEHVDAILSIDRIATALTTLAMGGFVDDLPETESEMKPLARGSAFSK